MTQEERVLALLEQIAKTLEEIEKILWNGGQR